MGRRLIWNLLFVLAAVGAGLALSIKPWQGYRAQQELADKHTSEMREAEANREQLARKKAQLNTKSGRELAARDVGYTRPGERPLDETE